MSRRGFLQTGACGLAAGYAPLGASRAVARAAEAPARDGNDRPNVVLILSDDHCQSVMGCMGDPYIQTPHTDRMASEGVLFENSFCVAGVCSPNRAAIFTGQYPHQCGAPHMCWMNHTFHGRARLFPAMLHDAGYHTAHIGKWHLGEGDQPKPGYDYWAGFQWVGDFDDPEFTFNGQKRRMRGFSDDIMTELAADYIAARAGAESPFCLCLAIKAPHLPFGYPERHARALEDVEIPKPDSFDEDYEETGRCKAIRDSMININAFPGGLKAFGNSWDRYIKSYYRSVMAIDDVVGGVMEALEANGVADNTLLVYTSDQGYNLGTHQLTEKHYAYEEAWRVPMVVRFPGRAPAGARLKELALTIDIAATALDYCGVPVPGDMTGRSWAPLFEGRDGAWREDIMFDAPTENDDNLIGQLAVRTDRHKLITYTRQPCVELYDLEEDPREMRNLAHDPAYAGVRAEMERRLARITAETGWAPYVPHHATACWALGPVDPEDVFRVERALAFTPFEAASFVSGGREFTWRRLEALPNKNFDLAAAFGAAPGTFAYLAVPLRLLAERDPFSILRYVPFRPIKAFQDGKVILEQDEPGWQATLNPVLDRRDSVIVLRFPCDGPPAVQLYAYAAENSVRAGLDS